MRGFPPCLPGSPPRRPSVVKLPRRPAVVKLPPRPAVVRLSAFCSDALSCFRSLTRCGGGEKRYSPVSPIDMSLRIVWCSDVSCTQAFVLESFTLFQLRDIKLIVNLIDETSSIPFGNTCSLHSDRLISLF